MELKSLSDWKYFTSNAVAFSMQNFPEEQKENLLMKWGHAS